MERGIESGLVPDSDIHRYFRITESDADLFLAIYGTTQEEEQTSHKGDEDHLFAGALNAKEETNVTHIMGAAIFKEGTMIGKLTGEETRLSVLLNDTLETSELYATFHDPYNLNYKLTARMLKKKDNDVQINVKKGPGEINVTIPLTIEILSNHSMINYAEHHKKRETLKKLITTTLNVKYEELIKKSQETWKGEPFGWSLIARRKFMTMTDYKKFDWMKSYPNMKVNVKVDISFGEFGRQGKLPNLGELRD